MPALHPVPNVVTLIVVYTMGIDPTVINRLHAIYTGGPLTNADAANVAGQFWNVIAADVMPHCTAGVQLTKVECIDLSSPTAGIGQSVKTAVPGSLTGSQAASVAVLANASIQRRYRGGKPRTYWPMGQPSDLQSGQQWTPPAVTTYQGAVNNVYTGMTGLTFSTGQTTQPCAISYYSGSTWYQENPPNGPYKRTPTPRPTPIVDPITSWTVSKYVGTQRRRIRGTGA